MCSLASVLRSATLSFQTCNIMNHGYWAESTTNCAIVAFTVISSKAVLNMNSHSALPHDSQVKHPQHTNTSQGCTIAH